MERKEPGLNLGLEGAIGDLLQNFISELAERLQKMEDVLVIDRIEGNLAVCENRKNGKMKNIPLEELPKGAKEGNVLKWNKNQYEIDNSNEIEERIANKMKNVWK